MSNKKQKFLIRSSGEILGPYTKEEVTTLIKKKKISIFDEVTEPFKIWMYLENHSDFKKIAQSMNVQTRLTNFLTQVSHRISVSKTKDKTQTETTKKESSTQTLKDIPKDVSFNLLPEAAQNQETQTQKPKNTMKSQLKIAKKITVKKAPAQSLEEKKKEELEKKIGFLMRFSWKLITLAGLLVGGAVLYKLSYTPIMKKKELIKELNSKGKKYYKAGDFKRALPFFERAQSHLTQEEKFLFSILLLQNNQAERFYLLKEEITDPSIRQKDTWLLFEGLGEFYSRRYSKAEKSFHDVILKNNKQTLNTAQLNLALLKLESGQYNEFINEINQLLIRSYERDMIWYLKALYFLNKGMLPELESYLLNDLGLGSAGESFVIEYKQELLFLLAYAYMKTGKMEQGKETVKRLLNQDPYFIKEYSYSPLAAKNKLNWNLLYPYCNEIFNFNPEESLNQALYSLCLIKTNQVKKAKSYIERAKNQEPENSLFLSLSAYLLMAEKESAQKIEQVFSLINYDSKSTRENNLAFIIKARFFEEAEYWDSALLVWKDLIRQNVSHISGLAGISFNSYQTGDESAGAFYRKKVLERYPYHIKVLPFE